MDVNSLEVEMAQHLLMAADQYQLDRLRRICEKRLCETVDVESVGLTLTLAEQNHAEELKKVYSTHAGWAEEREIACLYCTHLDPWAQSLVYVAPAYDCAQSDLFLLLL